MNRTFTLFVLLFLISFSFLNAQIKQETEIVIEWDQSTTDSTFKSINNHIFPTFKGAQYRNNNPIPIFTVKNEINSNSTVKAEIQIIDYEDYNGLIPGEFIEKLSHKVDILSNVSKEREKYALFHSFSPILKTAEGKVQLVKKLKITSVLTPFLITESRGPEFKNQSTLKDGDIYKFGVSKTGVYKLTYAQLQEFGIDPKSLNVEQIQIFGNPDGPIPEAVSAERNDDLIENAIELEGMDDGTFDEEDYILFYAHGPHLLKYDSIRNKFQYKHNIYADQNFYFLKTGVENGLRIGKQSSIGADIEHSSSYSAYRRYETDRFNLLADYSSTEGSGQLWFADKLGVNRSLDLSSFFADPNIIPNSPVEINIQFASRCASSSRLNVIYEDESRVISFNPVNVTNIQSTYADLEQRTFNFEVNSSNPLIRLDYPETTNTSEGWLDFISMEYRANLNYIGQELFFLDKNSYGFDQFGFRINSTSDNLTIWDITNPELIKSIETIKNGNTEQFSFENEGVRSFVAFEKDKISSDITFIGKIENQNLHSLSKADLIIVYHESFKAAAERLAEHRSVHSNLDVQSVDVSKIYNEYSSGKADPSAIRNFVRMIYTRDENFKYLLLFGDGSFDHRHINEEEYGDENFIPVYETKESLAPISAFPTDDYYALLDIQEGNDLKGQIDIAVGRLPVRTLDEANHIVDKIIHYESSELTKGDWRLRLGFASDDEDFNIHLRDADEIAEEVRLNRVNFNLEKIYFDAFPQISTPGGERFPEATESINNNIFKGMLTFCYLGHGGPKGWAQERVLKIADIESWDNEDKMPLIITATCSFTSFDDPQITSAGEVAFLKEKAGAIGLFTTVRAVYANQNARLTQAVFDTIFTRENDEYLRIGEILRRAKNSNSADTINVNARKFLLIGDPSMKLAIPEYTIEPTSINDQIIDVQYIPDTIKALQRIKIEGVVLNTDGDIATDFTGTLSCSLFDKVISVRTLGNNSKSSPRNFNIQNTILFNGKASIEDGVWNIEFYLPADINFEIGEGKLSFYAQSNDGIDAQGSFDHFYIGGSENVNEDDTPPIVDVYLNNTNFVSGGISSPDPTLLILLEDDFGINVSGVSVGHDLTAELDNDSKQRYVLNSFYESEKDNFRKGSVRFPLKDLENGYHTIKVKAWDLSNNLGEGFLEFYVSDDLEESLRNVLNYPNPFNYETNFQFEHNFSDGELEVEIEIFNLSGQRIKALNFDLINEGFRVRDLSWNGSDESGAQVANGVYLYKIKVRSKQLGIGKESNFEKLVVIR